MRRIGGAVLAVALVVAIAGCGGSNDDAANSAPTSASGGSTTGDPAEGDQVPDAGRSIVYTADIDVATGDLVGSVRQARAIAVANGGLLLDESIVLGDEAEASATLKVPPANLPSTLDQLGGLGEVLQRSQQAEDVTTQVVDLDARIASARASVTRLRELLAEAADVEDLVALEGELTLRETQLEQLVAEQRALTGQVELATVTASFSEPEEDDPIEGIPGVGTAFRAGLDAFVATVLVVVVVLTWALPFLALAGLVVGALLWWRARRSTRRGERAARGGPAPGSPLPPPMARRPQQGASWPPPR